MLRRNVKIEIKMLNNFLSTFLLHENFHLFVFVQMFSKQNFLTIRFVCRLAKVQNQLLFKTCEILKNSRGESWRVLKRVEGKEVGRFLSGFIHSSLSSQFPRTCFIQNRIKEYPEELVILLMISNFPLF